MEQTISTSTLPEVEKVRRILLVQLGEQLEQEYVQTLIDSLDRRFPQARITVLVTDSADLQPGLGRSVFEVVRVNRQRAISDRGYLTDLLQRLKFGEFELALNPMLIRDYLDDLLTVGSEAPLRIAYELGNDQPDLEEMQLYTHLVTVPENERPWHERSEDFTAGLMMEPKKRSAPEILLERSSKKAMSVAMLTVADRGGAGNAAYRLHKGLREIGVQSTMLVLAKKRDDHTVKVLPTGSDDAGVVRALDRDENMEAWKLATSRWKRNMGNYPHRPQGLETFTDAESAVRLEQVAKVRDADVINLHWIAGLVDFGTAQLALSGRPHVWTLHDMHAFTGGCHYSMGCDRYRTSCGACPALGSSQENDLSRSVWKTKDALYERINAHIVTPSRWLAETARSSSLLGRFPVHHIPYGLPTDIYKPHHGEDARRLLNLSPSDHVVLFGAQRVSNTRKGFVYLVDAIQHLVKQGDGAPIVFATFGNEPPPVKLPSPYRMVHLGSVGDEQMLAKVYSAADLFVIPSIEDNLPNTVIEAMSCGTPVVGFSVGGIPDMVEHKVTGFLASPFEAGELAEGIRWVLSQKNGDLDLSGRCRERVLGRYRLDIQAKAYLELFRNIIRD